MNAARTSPAEHRVKVHGIDLFAESFGVPDSPPFLLIIGNSAPGLVWPDRFCLMLAERGFFVVRFDQRDTGLSSHVDFRSHPYDLDQLAGDALGLLDAMGIACAHVAGLSQGGELAYRLALKAPHRVLSLVVVMSSADLRPKNDAFRKLPSRAGELARPAPAYVDAVIELNSQPAENEDQVAVRFVENFRLAKGSRSPFDEAHWLDMGQAIASIPRRRADGHEAAMANHSNHTQAQQRSQPLTVGQLAELQMPVLILHGAEDPIFPTEHARWSASIIPGSRLTVIDDMGHALDPAYFERILQEMTAVVVLEENTSEP